MQSDNTVFKFRVDLFRVECPLILGAGHPKFKNLQYLLCDLLDLTKPFIPVISEL